MKLNSQRIILHKRQIKIAHFASVINIYDTIVVRSSNKMWITETPMEKDIKYIFWETVLNELSTGARLFSEAKPSRRPLAQDG